MIFHAFLIKYAEIAIKGKNRYLFEDALVKQMNIALSKIEGDYRVVKEQGRVYVFCPEEYDFEEAVAALKTVFGIVYICPVVIYEDKGFEQMRSDVVEYMKNVHPDYHGTFKVYTRRAKKSYPVNSMEVSARIGESILDAFPEAKVDVHQPELTVSVEIREKIYVYSAINLSNQVSMTIINWLAPFHSCSISSRVLCFTYFCTYTQVATLLA